MESSNDTMIEVPEVHSDAYRKRYVPVGFVLVALLGITTPAAAFRPLPLSARDQKALRDNFALCTSKLKGPYTENFCVCPDGKKIPVRGANGRLGTGCKNPLFCAAFRAPWAEALAKQRRVHRQHLLARPLPLGQLSRSQRPRARLHPREVLHRDQSEPQAEPAARPSAACPAPSTRHLRQPRFFERYLTRSGVQRHARLPARLRAAEALLRARRSRPDREGARHGGAHSGGRSQVQAAARRDPQPALRRPDPAARGVSRQAAAGFDRALRSTQLIAEIKKLTALDERALDEPGRRRSRTQALRSQLTALLPAPNADPVDGHLLARAAHGARRGRRSRRARCRPPTRAA